MARIVKSMLLAVALGLITGQLIMQAQRKTR